MTDLPVTVRELRDEDHAFILDSWTNTLAYYSPCFSLVPKRVLKAVYRQQIDRLLSARPELFRLIVRDEDPDQIFGWSCSEPSVTHFVYVKERFRRNKLALMLGVDLAGMLTVSHWTKDLEHIDQSRITYKPSLFQEVLREFNQTQTCSSSKVHQRTGKQPQLSRDGRTRTSCS